MVVGQLIYFSTTIKELFIILVYSQIGKANILTFYLSLSKYCAFCNYYCLDSLVMPDKTSLLRNVWSDTQELKSNSSSICPAQIDAHLAHEVHIICLAGCLARWLRSPDPSVFKRHFDNAIINML